MHQNTKGTYHKTLALHMLQRHMFQKYQTVLNRQQTRKLCFHCGVGVAGGPVFLLDYTLSREEQRKTRMYAACQGIDTRTTCMAIQVLTHQVLQHQELARLRRCPTTPIVLGARHNYDWATCECCALSPTIFNTNWTPLPVPLR